VPRNQRATVSNFGTTALSGRKVTPRGESLSADSATKCEVSICSDKRHGASKAMVPNESGALQNYRLRCDFLPESHMMPREIQDRRRALRYRHLLVRQMVQMKNRSRDC
jgi:hypothetical protein